MYFDLIVCFVAYQAGAFMVLLFNMYSWLFNVYVLCVSNEKLSCPNVLVDIWKNVICFGLVVFEDRQCLVEQEYSCDITNVMRIILVNDMDKKF